MTRTLVAEDDIDLLEYVSLVLARAGHEICQARDGAEAIAALDSGVFDLVVTDHHMPHRTGREVLGHLADKGLPTKALLMSADHYLSDDAELAATLDVFLPKPFNRSSLLEAVDVLVGSRALPQQA